MSWWSSRKSRGTVVIRGDLVEAFILEPKILDLIDSGTLNIWSSESGGHVFTFLRSHEGMRPAYRNFGLFSRRRVFTLSQLRASARQREEIDRSRPEFYPWIYKYDFSDPDFYYSTKDWQDTRRKYCRTSPAPRKWGTRTHLPPDAGPACECCGVHFPNDLLHLHHIIPIRNGGSNRPTNLISVCAACHARIHEDAEILRWALIGHAASTLQIGHRSLEISLGLNTSPPCRFDLTARNEYTRLIQNLDAKEVKLYFHSGILEAFRHKHVSSEFQKRVEWYFQAGMLRRRDPGPAEWFGGTERAQRPVSSNEDFYDVSVLCIVLFVELRRLFYVAQRGHKPGDARGTDGLSNFVRRKAGATMRVALERVSGELRHENGIANMENTLAEILLAFSLDPAKGTEIVTSTFRDTYAYNAHGQHSRRTRGKSVTASEWRAELSRRNQAYIVAILSLMGEKIAPRRSKTEERLHQFIWDHIRALADEYHLEVDAKHVWSRLAELTSERRALPVHPSPPQGAFMPEDGLPF